MLSEANNPNSASLWSKSHQASPPPICPDSAHKQPDLLGGTPIPSLQAAGTESKARITINNKNALPLTVVLYVHDLK